MIARDHIRRRLWFKAVQPVKEIHEHIQSFLLGGLHRSAKSIPSFLHTWIIHKLKVFPLERDRIVEEKVWSISKNVGDGLLGEVPVETTRDIGEHEGNVVDQRLGEDGGQSGERIVGTDSDTWDGAIGEDKDGIN